MRKINILSWVFASLLVVSCDKFLDETPDNRTIVDSRDKVQKLLVNAYPSTYPMVLAELSSDNIIDQGDGYSLPARFYQELTDWKDITESNNDGISSVWEDGFTAISHSNLALDAIKKIEASGQKGFEGEKAEALITRAYSYFMLANIFCKAYNPQTSSTDLGLPYLETPEVKLDPKYDRGTMEELYKHINDDIEAALPNIDDNMYRVAQYHFTKKAAYAFAARFNLYYGKWEKAKQYATLALGTNPEAVIRDWKAFDNLPTDEARQTQYVNDESVFLTSAFTSYAWRVFTFGSVYRYNHTESWARFTLNAPMPWAPDGVPDIQTNAHPSNLVPPRNTKVIRKIPRLFEITNQVARTGYAKTAAAIFYADETLLVRAEAQIMLKEYDNALTDINLWTSKFYKNAQKVTLTQVKEFFDKIPYATDETPTIKNSLNPVFTVEQGEQESMIHFVLQCRRILTLHEGLRWYDLKRYGMEVRRFILGVDGRTETLKGKLSANDERKALQIPQETIASGLKANPR